MAAVGSRGAQNFFLLLVGIYLLQQQSSVVVAWAPSVVSNKRHTFAKSVHVDDKPPAVTRRQLLSTTVSFKAAKQVAASMAILSVLFKTRPVDAATDYVDGPRGLRYRITEYGDGDKPSRAQKVKTSYALYLNGFPDEAPDTAKMVDSSKTLGFDRPFEFIAGVSQVVKGWDLAVLDMRQGEARRLIVPPELGYGNTGAGGKIPGGATLYFEMKLESLGILPNLNEEQLKWLDDHPV